MICIEVEKLKEKIYELIKTETSDIENLWDKGYATCADEVVDVINALKQEKTEEKWSIKDAKPGDILSTDTVTFIFKNIDENGFVSMYCSYSVSTTGEDLDFSETAVVLAEKVHPATHQQQRILMNKLFGFRGVFEKKD